MNREKIKKISLEISKPVPLKWLRILTQQNFIFPFYHLACDSAPIHIKNVYNPISINEFESDIDFFLKHYHPASFENVLDFIKKNKKEKNPHFFLSFDDGLRECYDYIFPILNKKGIQAAIFLNPAFIDNKILFYKHKTSLIIEKLKNQNNQVILSEISKLLNGSFNKPEMIFYEIKYLDQNKIHVIDKIGEICELDFENYLKTEKPYMTMEQVRDLQKQGHIIGSHSYDHPYFNKIDFSEMESQINKSIEYLKKNFTPKSLTFAFPFADYQIPETWINYLYDFAGIEISFGTAGIKKDPIERHIQRIPMELSKIRGAKNILHSEYIYYCMKTFFGRNTIHR